MFLFWKHKTAFSVLWETTWSWYHHSIILIRITKLSARRLRHVKLMTLVYLSGHERSSTSAVISPQNVSLDFSVANQIKAALIFFQLLSIFRNRAREGKHCSAVARVSFTRRVERFCFPVVLRGGAHEGQTVCSVWFGLWSHTQTSRRGSGRIRVSFPASSQTLFLIRQTRNLQKWKEYLTAPLLLLTLNGRLDCICIPEASLCHLAGIKTCTGWLQFHLHVH